MMLVAVCLSSLLLLAGAEHSVHIRSKYGHGQLVTSSILTWIPDSHYSASKDLVIGSMAIVGNSSDDDPSRSTTSRPVFVCRAQHNGIWVAGGQKEGEQSCTVTLTGIVRTFKRYQLLENVRSAARLNWINWDKFSPAPVGAVATSSSQLYVARHKAEEAQASQTHYIGTLNSVESLGTISYVKEDGTEGHKVDGQLLIEIEPIYYELTRLKLIQGKRREVKRTPKILGQATIKNAGDSPAMMAEAFAYSYRHVIYWGQGHAMLKALNTTITLVNGTRLPNITWGIETKENRTEVHTVEVYLEPGTAVNVTLRGEYTEAEVPYTGELLSHYQDGATVNPRLIDGFHREEGMSHIKAEFGPIYFLSNMSLVPTTEAPPSTEATPSTNPTTPRAGQQQETEGVFEDIGLVQQQHSKDVELDENAIPRKRPEDMQGDGSGGPQAEGSRSGAAGLRPFLALTLALLAHLRRAT